MIARKIVKFWLVSLNKKKKKKFMREEEEDDNLAINFNQSRVSTVGIRSKREKKKKKRPLWWVAFILEAGNEARKERRRAFGEKSDCDERIDPRIASSEMERYKVGMREE